MKIYPIKKKREREAYIPLAVVLISFQNIRYLSDIGHSYDHELRINI